MFYAPNRDIDACVPADFVTCAKIVSLMIFRPLNNISTIYNLNKSVKQTMKKEKYI